MRYQHLCSALLCGVIVAPPLAAEWQLSAAEWARPRHADWLLQTSALTTPVTQLLANPNVRLRLRYAGGEAGVVWANELQAWLVALGIASDRIEQLPGRVPEQQLQLQVIHAGD